MRSDNTSATDGHAIELMCADLMRQKGYTIIAQNYRSGPLELDLIVMEGTTLCFIEVKARSNLGALRDLESLITAQKQLNILRAAKAFLQDKKGGRHLVYSNIRFDYLLIYVPKDGREPGYKIFRNAIYDMPPGYEDIRL